MIVSNLNRILSSNSTAKCLQSFNSLRCLKQLDFNSKRNFRCLATLPSLPYLHNSAVRAASLTPGRLDAADIQSSIGCHSACEILIKRGVKVYTRTGDRGTSSTLTGSRHAKDHEIFEALGTIDELSALLGLAREISEERKHAYCEELERIQCLLQDAATTIAQAKPLPAGGLSPDEISNDQSQPLRSSGVTADHVKELEAWIDKYTENLPPLTNFILPGGGRASAGLHVARTVCRRAERRVVALIPHFALDYCVLKYINRLSDYLFTIARYATIADQCKEVIYINPNKPKKSIITAESQTLSDA